MVYLKKHNWFFQCFFRFVWNCPFLILSSYIIQYYDIYIQQCSCTIFHPCFIIRFECLTHFLLENMFTDIIKNDTSPHKPCTIIYRLTESNKINIIRFLYFLQLDYFGNDSCQSCSKFSCSIQMTYLHRLLFT